MEEDKNASRYIKYNGELDVAVHVKLAYHSDCLEIALLKPNGKLIAIVYVRDEKYKEGKELCFEEEK